ncbi:pyridoxamine 5'-phosphate oxidase [Aliifodinibius sp. S!AR15-10]|uniref:pyridoxamine 5'-phosphate oxidase n=1 Tax=Aliifodinibius sp. S!AR15-10 TaxID=2950437 RepID=UPI0028651ECD|nr:pyridoxamine 5'-phosphate oxidase [Aliifodinibius sp. S!AR15-10]MDR8393545.1 pyridoxamine 5'-phosphate oxidase [Aliifodinibius sp. S!AR15-10]
MVDAKSNSERVEALRREYKRDGISEESVQQNPLDQFTIWFEDALNTDMTDANAMTLATSTSDGKPSSRIVLLKGFDEEGFRFYTNYDSRKGKELSENPHAALCFYWPALERQVRIEGTVSKLSREQSASYFRSRPRDSQIGAWASQQSSRLKDREELEANFEELKQKFKDQEVPLPDFWGGYTLLPEAVEFWQGRTGRLHDRILYIRPSKDQEWEIQRLNP